MNATAYEFDYCEPLEIGQRYETDKGATWDIFRRCSPEECGMSHGPTCHVAEVYSLEPLAKCMAAAPAMFAACRDVGQARTSIRAALIRHNESAALEQFERMLGRLRDAWHLATGHETNESGDSGTD